MTNEEDSADVQDGASRKLTEALVVELARVAPASPLPPHDTRRSLSPQVIAAVADFVSVMRAAAATPERMLVVFKRSLGSSAPADVERALISAAISAYFNASVGAAPTTDHSTSAVSRSRGRSAVLVVDDNEDSRYILGAMLQGEGIDALLASNGAEAVLIARHAELAIILLDLAMPGLDGKQVLGLLRELSEIRATPVIAITSFPALAQAPDLLSSGFAEVLMKPIGPADLRRVLARYSPGLLSRSAPI